METRELRASYLTPFLDENLMKEDYTGPGPLLAWYTQDGLGSVRQLVVGDSVMNSYAYTAWGVPLNWHETVSNRYTFAGREYNPEDGKYFCRSRILEPEHGRMTQSDRARWFTTKDYLWCSNNPVRFTDPSGQGHVLVAVGRPSPGRLPRHPQFFVLQPRSKTYGTFLLYPSARLIRVGLQDMLEVRWITHIEFHYWLLDPSRDLRGLMEVLGRFPAWVQFVRLVGRWHMSLVAGILRRAPCRWLGRVMRENVWYADVGAIGGSNIVEPSEEAATNVEARPVEQWPPIRVMPPQQQRDPWAPVFVNPNLWMPGAITLWGADRPTGQALICPGEGLVEIRDFVTFLRLWVTANMRRRVVHPFPAVVRVRWRMTFYISEVTSQILAALLRGRPGFTSIETEIQRVYIQSIDIDETGLLLTSRAFEFTTP